MAKQKLNQLELGFTSQSCPVCKEGVQITLAEHFKLCHSEKEFHDAILKDKSEGIPDIEIGRKYGISYRYLEKIITKRGVETRKTMYTLDGLK